MAVVLAASLIPALVRGASADPVKAAHPSDFDPDAYVATVAGAGRFPLVEGVAAAPLVVSSSDHQGVRRVVGDLQDDIAAVTDVEPALSVDGVPSGGPAVLVGTLGNSGVIDSLVASGKLDVAELEGRWEMWVVEVVDEPWPGAPPVLVIAGSDQRGTIYGVYDLSRQIGVSPWHFWADVPPHRAGELFVLPGRHSRGEPAVRYRGLFINDEWPNLAHWANHYFGPGRDPDWPMGFNGDFYERIFEVVLRLKANTLWPAVWGRAFALDDPRNHELATAYGVVMGTSHEAPMLRGIEEWNRGCVGPDYCRGADPLPAHPGAFVGGSDPYGGNGQWSFRSNGAAVQAYWREGIQRMVDEDIEGIVTVGMRGAGDTGLQDGPGIDLMNDIIATEQQIIEEVTGHDSSETQQVFTLYKEVLRYWEQGIKVPDDVTVVFADDNWGSLLKLPDLTAPPRSGGYGLYYHFDYVGSVRSYKWVDTTKLANTREQLRTAYDYGVDRVWVANVGDVKNSELPLEFFLDFAWDPDAIGETDIAEWTNRWAARQFGPEHADAIGAVLHRYGELQSLRKPELLNLRYNQSGGVSSTTDNPFNLHNYREVELITEQWTELAAEAERLRMLLPAERDDAYFNLVHYPVAATANAYGLRLANFTNRLYYTQQRVATNTQADLAEAHFAADQALSAYYNNTLADGKWSADPTVRCLFCHGFQNQAKFGYGSPRYLSSAWRDPMACHKNPTGHGDDSTCLLLNDEIYPAVQRSAVPPQALMGVAVDGSSAYYPAQTSPLTLPVFSPYQTQPLQYLEVFARGSQPFDYTITPAQPWVHVDPASGTVDTQIRATVTIDYDQAPTGTTTVPITVTGPTTATVNAVIHNPDLDHDLVGHIEASGHVSIDADRPSRVIVRDGIGWRELPDIGRLSDGMTPSPVTAPSQTPGGDSPRLEYDLTLTTTGPVQVWAYLSPRNNVLSNGGLRYAISFDDDTLQTVDIRAAHNADPISLNAGWGRGAADNVNRTVTSHTITEPGTHTLKLWMVDPTVIVQKVVIDTGGLRTSYLGPPQSMTAEEISQGPDATARGTQVTGAGTHVGLE